MQRSTLSPRPDMASSRSTEQSWQDFTTTGDLSARDRLVATYMPLVTGVAAGVRAGLPSSVDKEDLVSDGFIGLLDAMEKFEPERGLAFQTYATYRIRGAILDGLRTATWVPRSVFTKLRAVNAAVEELEGSLGRSPSQDEVAAAMDLSPGELDQIYATTNHSGLLSLESAALRGTPTLRSVDGLPGSDHHDIPDGSSPPFARSRRETRSLSR